MTFVANYDICRLPGLSQHQCFSYTVYLLSGAGAGARVYGQPVQRGGQRGGAVRGATAARSGAIQGHT